MIHSKNRRGQLVFRLDESELRDAVALYVQIHRGMAAASLEVSLSHDSLGPADPTYSATATEIGPPKEGT